MGYNFAGAGGGDQGWLLPPDPREWLPAGHLAWAVREAVGGMDLSPFLAGYRADGQGKKAYHPALMVALVMYCYCKGVRSSRAVEMATYDDVGARVRAVKGLLVASLAACASQGLVSVDVVAGDGTKVKASASMAANATAEQLWIEIGELEAVLAAEVDAWFAQARAADAAEDALFGGGSGGRGPGGGGPGSLARLADKIARRQKAKARLDAEAGERRAGAGAAHRDKIARLERRVATNQDAVVREEAAAAARVKDYQTRAAAKAAAGSAKRPDGRMPVPADRLVAARRARRALGKAEQALAAARAAPAAPAAAAAKANTTDPASRVDTGALHPLLTRARANLDAAGIRRKIKRALFDAGYASEDNFTAGCEAELYVAVTREARQTGRLADGKTPRTMKDSWQQMAARLGTPQGKALYRQRSAIIEPVFAQLFARLGRDLHYRDTKADLELHLWAASHNLLKAIRARAHPAAATQAGAPAPA